MLLEPLPADESATLIRNLVGESVLQGALGRRIVETAEGNPLFVEEMIGMLVDAGVLTREGDGWQLNGDLDRVEVPPTIQALLAARLDRLPPAERAVAQRGSVIGRTFEQLAVSELSPEADRSQIVSHLRGLVRHQVIGPYQADDIFRFRHLLIRDAAYEGSPRRSEPSSTSASQIGSRPLAATVSSRARRSWATTSSRRMTTGTGSGSAMNV